MPRVVIIGGSFAGLSAVSIVAKNDPTAEITLISPSTHAYFNVAAPRLLVEPELFDKTVFPVAELVKKNSKGRGTFILGSATRVDPDARKVQYSTSSGDGEVEYDFLVVASGTQTAWAGYKTNLDYRAAQKDILLASKKLKSAKSVAIIGAGATGVETAGEIASAHKSVKVDLYAGKGPLASLSSNLTPGATSKLHALGVNVILDVRVKRGPSNGHNESVVVEEGKGAGSETAYDLVFECYVAKPYSDFLPSSIKDDRGYVLTNGELLVKGYDNIAAFGDVVSGSGLSIVDFKMGQIGKFTLTFRTWVNGGVASPGLMGKIFGKRAPPAGLYQAVKNTYLVPISRNGGVGSLFGWRTPNFLVYFLKSKDFMILGARGNFS